MKIVRKPCIRQGLRIFSVCVRSYSGSIIFYWCQSEKQDLLSKL